MDNTIHTGIELPVLKKAGAVIFGTCFNSPKG
jgi:hypothetical protein